MHTTMKELHIKLSEPQKGTYQAEVIAPPQGADSFDVPTNSLCTLELPPPLPYDNLALPDFQGYLLDLKQHDTNQLEAIGAYLHDFLFGSPDNRNILYNYWGKCYNEVQESSSADGMRTVLQLGSPTLVSLPWELCNEEGEYLSALMSVRPHTLVRTAWKAVGINNRPPVPLPNARTLEPLRVLLAICHSSEDYLIKGPDEALGIDAALFKLLPWMVDLHIMIRPTLEEIKERCQKWEPHVLHFVGHGETTNNEPYLRVYQRGQSETLSRNAMINLFGNKVPRLVVLNACRSGVADAMEEGTNSSEKGVRAASATRSFSERLIQKGVLAVIALQADIKGEDAVTLMCKFYEELAGGKSIDQALTSARLLSFAAGNFSTEKWDWALPALYLSKGVRAEDVLCLNGNTTEPLIFSGAVPERHGVPLSLGVKIHVGREKEQITLAKAVLAPDLSAVPPILLLHGIPDMGKTTMLYWLAECCARQKRSFIYADFGRKPLDYWDVLRLIRDGHLVTKVKGVKLHSQLNPEVIFSQFNYVLNCKFIAPYAAAHPEPNNLAAVQDEAPESNLAAELEKQGTVQSDENLLETISAAFWSGLACAAEQNGLVIFLDHIEKMAFDTVAIMRRHLIDRILLQGNSASGSIIRLVIAVRDPAPFADPSDSDKPWHFLLELAQTDSQRVLELKFEGLPHEQLSWLAQVWARRYFISYGGSDLVRRILGTALIGNRLRPQDVDAYVNRQVASYLQPVAPGRLIKDLLRREDIIDWLTTLPRGAL
jgi:hypothetical protein